VPPYIPQAIRDSAAANAFAILHSSKREGLEQALRDLYKSCFVHMQVSSLNYVGFRKLVKKANKKLGKRACDKVSMPQKDELKQYTFFLEASEDSSPEARSFFDAVERIEACYAKKFTKGDHEKAKGILRALRRPPASKGEVMFMGTLVGAVLTFLLWSAWLLKLPDHPSNCPFCTSYLLETLPAFRVMLVPMVWLWIWAVCCKIWENTAINYIYIMDCDQRTALGSSLGFRMAGIACTLLLAVFVAYVAALRTYSYFEHVPPMLYPLFLLVFAAFNLVFPPIGNVGFASTKRYFLGCIGRSALAPLFEVRFRENFVADVMTSMVVILRDVAAMVFFYLSGGATGMPRDPEPAAVGSYLNLARVVTGPLITALPYYWRLMQCLRRWHDTPLRSRMAMMHLVNAGKYLVSLGTITFAAIGCHHGCEHFYTQSYKWTPGRVGWFCCLCIGTVYSYIWDITMDWSLFEPVPKEEGGWQYGPFCSFRLRTARRYEYTWFYWTAIFTNLVGRLMWGFTIQPHIHTKGVPAQVFTTVIAVVEVLRRGQWALLRLENEHQSNASNYRSVADVPLMVELAEKQTGRRNKLNENESSSLTRRVLAACLSVKSGALLLLTTAFTAAAVYIIYVATHMS